MLKFRSQDIAKEALRSESDRVQVLMIELLHESFSLPYRFASSGRKVYGFDDRSNDPVYSFVHNNVDYIVVPFEITLSDTTQTIPQVKLSIVNADPEISAALQDLKTVIKVVMTMAFDDEPDIVTAEFPVLYLTEVTISFASIEGTLKPFTFYENVVPSISIMPSIFPGCFT